MNDRIWTAVMYRVFFSVCFALVSGSSAQEGLSQKKVDEMKKISQTLTRGQTIELEALEIRARIHEPSLFYVLDRPDMEVDFGPFEESLLPLIDQPIIENQL